MDDWFRNPRAYHSGPDLAELMHRLNADIGALRQEVAALQDRAGELGGREIALSRIPALTRPHPAAVPARSLS